MRSTRIKAITLTFNFSEGDGSMAIGPDASPVDVRRALAVIEFAGFRMVDEDESLDDPEILEDGTIVVPLALEATC